MNHRVLRRVAFALSVAVIVTGLAAVGLGAGAFGGFQRRASDTLFPSAKTDPRVVVVGIDQKSGLALGPYSNWPRSYQAQLATQLARAGAGAAAWDAGFAGWKADDAPFAAALPGRPAGGLARPAWDRRTAVAGVRGGRHHRSGPAEPPGREGGLHRRGGPPAR